MDQTSTEDKFNVKSFAMWKTLSDFNRYAYVLLRISGS